MIFTKFFYAMLFFLSCFLTWGVKCWALKVGCMDIPSDRSSHTIPTPRGGGIAFVSCFILGLFGLAQQRLIPLDLMQALMTVGITTALLGYLDDRYHLSAGIRLFLQLVFVSVALYLLCFFEAQYTLFFCVSFVVFCAWLVNLFNFMDGIDGYVAMEAIFVAVSLAIMHGSALSFVMLCLSASVLGFALWNFPKAKIFMGDVGSGFLGGIFAICFAFLLKMDSSAFWGAMILIALFFVDSSFTLAKRAWRLEPIWKAHKQHAYQRLAAKFGSHVPVTLMGLAINVLWLLPLSYWTTFEMLPVWGGVTWAFGGVSIWWLWASSRP